MLLNFRLEFSPPLDPETMLAFEQATKQIAEIGIKGGIDYGLVLHALLMNVVLFARMSGAALEDLKSSLEDYSTAGLTGGIIQISRRALLAGDDEVGHRDVDQQ